MDLAVLWPFGPILTAFAINGTFFFHSESAFTPRRAWFVTMTIEKLENPAVQARDMDRDGWADTRPGMPV